MRIRKPLGVLAAMIAPLAAAAFAVFGLSAQGTAAAHSAASLPPEARVTSARWLNGVALPGIEDLAPFTRSTGSRVQLVTLYTPFRDPLPVPQMREIIRTGAMPMLQVNPRHVNLAVITVKPATTRYCAPTQLTSPRWTVR